MNAPRDFGPGLKALRERRGITLETIATATKIGAPLLEGLERNDVSRWPNGIYRRAFLRDYAAAIGAPVEETLAEFVRLFPDSATPGVFLDPPTPLRMTLAPRRSRARMRAIRAGAGCLDLLLAAAIGLAAAWALGVDRSNAIAVTALLYYAVTAAWLGHGLAMAWLSAGTRVPAPWRAARSRTPSASITAPADAERETRAATVPAPERRSGVDRRVGVVVHQPDSQPVAEILRFRKGSAA